jgi:hypothetical protein
MRLVSAACKLPPFALGKFVFSSAVGQAQMEVDGFTLYPNPAKDVVFSLKARAVL